MLSIATSWAEVLGASAIYIGAVAEDSSGYPDCRPEFYAAFQETINTGTKPDTRIEIRTPIIDLTKAEIVKKGIELSAPLHLTWSCYRSEDLACGTCDSCALRLRGFDQAGVARSDQVPNRILRLVSTFNAREHESDSGSTSPTRPNIVQIMAYIISEPTSSVPADSALYSASKLPLMLKS